MTDPRNALLAALEAAGLPLQSLPEEQRAMFTSLTDEEVTRLIELCARQETAEPEAQAGTDRPAAGH